MARLTVVSGVGGKLPAAFLLELEGRRLLLDLGEGPQPGVLPDVTDLGSVDAICLSHAHMDHAGALQLAASLGHPPVYATEATFRHIDTVHLPSERCRVLPPHGRAAIAGIPVLLGRSGHAPGGVWLHFAADGGILYTGDWSCESMLLPFDPPPSADLVVTDASYGDRDDCLQDQIDAIAAAASGGAVLPVPGGGRGPEMALALHARDLRPRVCPQVRREMEALADDREAIFPGTHRALCDFLSTSSSQRWAPTDIIIAAEANGEAGLTAELVDRIDEGFRFVFSSHVPAGTPAAALIAAGRAIWLAWNVHPRLRDVIALAESTGARRIVPAFVRPQDMKLMRQRLGSRLVMDRTIVTEPDHAVEGI